MLLLGGFGDRVASLAVVPEEGKKAEKLAVFPPLEDKEDGGPSNGGGDLL